MFRHRTLKYYLRETVNPGRHRAQKEAITARLSDIVAGFDLARQKTAEKTVTRRLLREAFGFVEVAEGKETSLAWQRFIENITWRLKPELHTEAFIDALMALSYEGFTDWVSTRGNLVYSLKTYGQTIHCEYVEGSQLWVGSHRIHETFDDWVKVKPTAVPSDGWHDLLYVTDDVRQDADHEMQKWMDAQKASIRAPRAVFSIQNEHDEAWSHAKHVAALEQQKKERTWFGFLSSIFRR